MKELGFKLTGITPLLMHDNKMANPLNAYTQYMKPLTAKRNKTDKDHMEIARIEWEAGLYLHDGAVAIPAENLEACFLKAAKRTKNGQKYQSGAMISEDWFPLDYKGQKIKIKQNGQIPVTDLDKYYDNFKHQAMVKIGAQQVLRTRPIFHDWSIVMMVIIDEQVFDERTMQSIVEDAGRFVGLCEKRPRLGRFTVEKI